MIWHDGRFEQSHMRVALQNDWPGARYDLARSREPQPACIHLGKKWNTMRGAESDEVCARAAVIESWQAHWPTLIARDSRRIIIVASAERKIAASEISRRGG
jgi:hypothetical protein